MVISKPSVQMLTVSENAHGQRLDNFLFTAFKSVPKSLIYKNIRTGNIRVNKKRCKPEQKLQSGDMLRIPPFRQAEKIQLKPDIRWINLLKQRIIYEDEHLLAINKPAGLAAHSGSGIAYGVIEVLQQTFPEQKFLQLAHRLDRDTSGCLLIAKNRTILLELQNLFRSNKIKKIYWALTKGRWKTEACRVSLPLYKNINQSGERMVKVVETGKEAITDFKVIQNFGVVSLMEVSLKTGRTHQIRVHAAESQHPLAGDEKYGDKDFNKLMHHIGLKRLFLHAARLEFSLVSLGKTFLIQAPLEIDSQRVLQNLEK